MLPGPTSESSPVVSPIQEIPMPLPEDVLWSESMFDPHPGQALEALRGYPQLMRQTSW